MSLTPLELPGWIEYASRSSGLRARPFSASNGGPEVRAVLYLDRRGRIQLPANHPYVPVVFRSERQRPGARTAEWLRAAVPLVEEMRRRGLGNLVILPPDVDDVRPWQWRGFMAGVRYTYCLDFPFDPALMERGHRQNHDRAARRGMTAERTEAVGPVAECLAGSQARKGFSLGIGARELAEMRDLLDEDGLRMYACFDQAGQAAASCVVLHAPGARAIAWLAGTGPAGATSGAGHLLWPFVFSDLEAAGATGIDLCGANIEPIADFKSRWGARLVPTYTVRTYSLRAGARFLADWIGSRRGSKVRGGRSEEAAGGDADHRDTGAPQAQTSEARRSVSRPGSNSPRAYSRPARLRAS